MSAACFVAAPTQAQQTNVRLAYGAVAIEVALAPWLTAAKTAGYWQEEGLNVELLGVSGSNSVMQLIAAGEVDVGFVSATELMNQVSAGVPIKVIAAAYNHSSVYPAVLDDSPIESIEDLRGKRIGVGSMTGNTAAWTRAILTAYGIDESEVEIVPSGHGGTAFFTLTNDRIDVLITNQNDYAVLEGMFDLDLRRMNDIPIVSEAKFAFGFVARNEMIENQPEVLEALLRGVAKGLIFANANPEAAARGHFEQFPRSVPSDMSLEEAVTRGGAVINASIGISRDSALARTWGLVTGEQIENMRDLMFDLGSVREKLPWEQYYTPQFIEAINDFDIDAVISDALAAE